MGNITLCHSCRSKSNPTDYQCGICSEIICKKCCIFTKENFSYYRTIPTQLTHSCYCSVCYDKEIAEPTQTYLEMIEKSKEIIVYSKNESKKTRLMSRKMPPYIVENCDDEEDALRRMSFFAVQDNFNCLIDIEFSKKKIIVGSHKKFIWTGYAIPVNIPINHSSVRQ